LKFLAEPINLMDDFYGARRINLTVFAGIAMRGSSITFEDYTLEEILPIFRHAGFDIVEMWRHHLRRCKTDELRKNFVAYAKSLGISMGGLNVVGEEYFRPFGSDQELELTAAGLKDDAEFALSLGTRDVMIWEGRAPKGTGESYWISELLPRLIELFRAVISELKPQGIRFLVEPHPFTVGMSDQLLIKLYDALEPGHFGILFDFCHYGVGRPNDYLLAIRNLGHRIRHIHFSDTDQKTSEMHFPPGSGRLQLQGALDAFREIGYDGTITLDLFGYPMPLHALPGGAARLREACEFLGLPC
jgi:sugar phosphate isomerase/epimerase